MFTEPMLRQNPALVKALTGVPATEFWNMLEQMEAQLPAYDAQRLARPDRQRAIGGGRECDQPLALRTMAGVMYLRLHPPQTGVALLFGMTQPDLSRDLRRLLPLIQRVCPCPEVWKVIVEEQTASQPAPLLLEQLADGRALVDATEQRISRPSNNETRK